MKSVFKFILPVVATICLLSCEETNNEGPNDDNNQNDFSDTVALIINYGSYGTSPTTFTLYNLSKDSVYQNVYETANTVPLTSNVQYASVYGSSIYLIGNESDQVIRIAAEGFQQTINGISESIHTPRYCVPYNGLLYISCWGAAPDWDKMPDSYIAVFDTAANQVVSTIALPGGPEGLAIANGNLYAALNFVDSIGVVNLQSENVEYIATPAVSSYFLKDKGENLYVSLLSTYSDPSDVTGLAYVNTLKNTVDTVYSMANVSSAYVSIMQFNSDTSAIYVMASNYDDNWNLIGGVSKFNLASKSVDHNFSISGISGMNGVSVNPFNDDIFVYISESVQNTGLVKVYSPDGNEIKSIETGKAPFMALFSNY